MLAGGWTSRGCGGPRSSRGVSRSCSRDSRRRGRREVALSRISAALLAPEVEDVVVPTKGDREGAGSLFAQSIPATMIERDCGVPATGH